MSKTEATKVKARREYFRKAIQKTEKQMQECEASEWSAIELEERVKQLQGTFEKFEAKCVQLCCECDLSEDEKKQIENDSDAIEAIFLSTKSKMRMRMELQKKSDVTEVDTSTENEMKKLQISDESSEKIMRCDAKFNGEFQEWYAFESKFTEIVIGNETLSDSEKLKLVTNACENEAKHILIALNPKSFGEAWDKLLETYGSTYKQLQLALKSVWNIQAISEPSFHEINRIVTQMNNCQSVFEKIPNCGDFKVFMAVIAARKMDQNTLRQWDRHRSALAIAWEQGNESESPKRKAYEHVPDWDAVKKFLVSEMQFYSGQQAIGKSEPNQANTGTVTKPSGAGAIPKQTSSEKISSATKLDACDEKSKQPKFLQCVLCPGIHPVRKCDNFTIKNIDERYEHVADHRLCVRCLRPDHDGDCLDSKCNLRCPNCVPKVLFHNSLLCPNAYKRE